MTRPAGSASKGEYDYAELGEEFSRLGEGKEYLSDSHIDKLFDKDKAPFEEFWGTPVEAMQRLNRSKRAAVQRLLDVFKNIGHVSLILRFTHPEHFAIFSSPIADLLLVHDPSTVELYVTYCQELKLWEDHFRCGNVAHTEMALWAFYQLTKGWKGSMEPWTARRKFEEDVWIQQRRVALTLGPFFSGEPSLELAEILREKIPVAAALIAGREFERLLDKKAPKLSDKDSVWKRLQRLKISPDQRKVLNDVWDLRGDVVHPRRECTSAEVAKMISHIRGAFDPIMREATEMRDRSIPPSRRLERATGRRTG